MPVLATKSQPDPNIEQLPVQSDEMTHVFASRKSGPDFSASNPYDDVVSGQTAACLGLYGELDLASAPICSDAIDQMLDSGVEKLTLDLTNLRFMDCSGLAVLIATHQFLAQTGGEMILRSPATNVRRLFELTGLTTAFIIEGSTVS
jgi:anti-sigma B factor antagonist